MRKMPDVKVKFDIFPLSGGLDLNTPHLLLKPGVARNAINFEHSVNGGYTRIPGYERYSGQASPSLASFSVLLLSTVAGVTVGSTLAGASSLATSTVAAIDGLNVVVTEITGTFQTGELFTIAGTIVGQITTVGVAITDQVLNATYQLAAANVYRGLISAPTGVNGIVGGFYFNGVNYCVRANAGNTSLVIYAASGSGWTAVPLYNEVYFTAGGGSPVVGGTIVKGGVSAVIKNIVVTSGAFGSSNAVGKFIIANPTGGNFTAGALTGTVTGTLTGAQTPITLTPGGRYQFTVGNAGSGVKVYGTDGVNRCIEFDGSVVTPIDSGFTPDAPKYNTIHKNHVFLAMGSTASLSAAGSPYVWNVALSAGAIVVSAPITGFMVLPGSITTAALAVLSDNTINILYGTDPTNFTLTELKLGAGCKPYASQVLGQGYIYDNLGFMNLQAVQAYGNFIVNSLTMNIRDFVQQRRNIITDSTIHREKSQYRVFYSDGYGLFITMVNGQFLGAMPVQFPNPVSVVWEGTNSSGQEVTYFGSTNGMVYQMDTGTSFDGAAISWQLDLAFNAEGNSRTLKTYRMLALEVQGQTYVQFLAGVTLAYGNAQVVTTAVPTNVNPSYWDQFTWDNFVWDGSNIAPSVLQIHGTGENCSLHIEGNSALWGPHTINSVALHYTPRRTLRS